MLNLKQIIADVDEIHHIRSLPHFQDYLPQQRATQSDLIIMSMTPQDRMKTALEKKLHLVRRLREKIIFRMKAAEE